MFKAGHWWLQQRSEIRNCNSETGSHMEPMMKERLLLHTHYRGGVKPEHGWGTSKDWAELEFQK